MTQNASTLVLAASAREELLSHAREGGRESPPAEVCGVLVGTRDGEGGDRVRSTRRVSNVADTPRTAYELDPAETMDAVDAVEAAGDDVVGFYHSHPESRARPSATDRERATWTGYVYLIVGLGPDDPEVRAWRWTGSAFDPLSVRVE
ncbi:MAG: desampylase [Haloferacaceae archaeon]